MSGEAHIAIVVEVSGREWSFLVERLREDAYSATIFVVLLQVDNVLVDVKAFFSFGALWNVQEGVSILR